MAAEANDVLAALTAAFPRSAHAQSVKGSILSLFGKSAEAMRCWRQSLVLDPDFAPGYRQIAGKLTEDGEYAEAVELLQQAMELDQTMPGLANQLADALMYCGKMQEALAVMEQGKRSGTAVAGTHYLLGQILLQLRRYEEARTHLLRAIEENPEDTDAYYVLANVCARLGDRKQAANWRQRFQSLKQAETKRGVVDMRNREDRGRVRGYLADAYLEAGKVYQYHGELAQAEHHWLKAAAYEPADIESRTALARLYRDRNDQLKLVKVLQQLVSIEPDNAGHLVELGRSLLQLGQLDRAEGALTRACELAEDRPDAYSALALFYVQTGRNAARTIPLAQQAVDLQPSAEHYFVLGVAHQSQGDYSAAVNAVRQAVAIEPGNTGYRQAYEQLLQSR